jgi:site-specific recombinase XerD
MTVEHGHHDAQGATEAPDGGVAAPSVGTRPLGSPPLASLDPTAPPGPARAFPPPGQAAQGREPPNGGAVEEAAVGELEVGETQVVVSTGELRARSGVAVFRQAARSPNTLLAYRRDWDRFAAWCARAGVVALPAEPGVVASYLAEAASTPDMVGRSAPWRYSPATLERWLSTINKAHDLAGLLAPGRDAEVRDTLAGVKRVRAAPPRRKMPLLLADLERVVANIDVTGWPAAPGGIRNRCLLVMGWVGAFRRDELVRLTVGDVTLHADDGLHVAVRVSKGDPGATGRTYALPYAGQVILCAPCAWLRWRRVLDAWDGADGGPGGRAGVMRYTRTADVDRHVCRDHPVTGSMAGSDAGAPLFRSVRANGTLGGPINGEAVNQVVKRSAAAVGFDPERLGGHSLRAGFVTQAFRAGAEAHAIMRQTGHRDPKTLEIYARETAPLVGNAVTQIGL